MGKIPVFGYINDIAIGPKARFCVAAIGQEPRLGRWDRIARSKNRFAIIKLRENDTEENEEENEETEDSGEDSETHGNENLSSDTSED